ncbi:MAG: phosphate acyltransferase PlsX [Clostridia bacterium]|nr:phosphate acyltransferase PlsX [Clostridia bacterium]
MKIVIDAFGGDNAPLSNIEGAALAVKEYGAQIILCGDEQKIRKCANENNISLDGIEILQADEVFDIHDDPNLLLKSKKNTSLAVSFQAVADGKADAVISAGSSGAVLMGGTFIVKRIKGIKRPAFASVLPTTNKPYMLLDMGANIDVRSEILVQFAIVGSAYMKNVLGIENPKVGLINIGAEETKGGEMLVETYQRMKDEKSINFIGNVEPRDLPNGVCDVAVCDGFTGNVVLKLTEGVAMSMMKMVKGILYKNIVSKIAALMIKSGLYNLKKKFDYSEQGGAPLIGVKAPVIKAHGSSDAKAIKSSVKQAIAFASTGVIEDIENAIKGDK